MYDKPIAKALNELNLDGNDVEIHFDKTHPDLISRTDVLGCYWSHFVCVRASGRTLEEVLNTLRHELRHYWQEVNGWKFDQSLPYMQQKHEIDAFKWAELWSYTVKTLKCICRDKGIKGYNNKTKKEIINLLMK